MDFFRKIGKTFEETKQNVLAGSSDPYRCTDCEKGLTEFYETCPYCGSEAVEAVE